MDHWDEDKRRINIAKHGVDFAAASDFEWETALTVVDARCAYGELRFQSIGFIGERLHVLVWTPRPETRRLISLRRANRREIMRYVKSLE